MKKHTLYTKHRAQSTDHSEGFTLVEMAIVLVVIGLIVAGIMGGSQMIRQAEIKSVITDAQGYQSAVDTFHLQYMALPGDMNNAYAFWDSDCGSNANVCNGDGNGSIKDSSDPIVNTDEEMAAWVHLALSHVISGPFNNTTVNQAQDPGITIPGSKLEGGGFRLFSATIYAQTGNAISFASDTGTLVDGDILRPEEAWNIDKKIDDGRADTGMVMGESSGATNDCAAGTYSLGDTNVVCVLYFYLDK